MAYALKSTGLATDLVACLIVDEDGATIVDLCGNSISIHPSIPAVGAASWKGVTRSHIVTGGDGGYTPYGIAWTGTKPSANTNDADGIGVFVALAGASGKTGGTIGNFVHIDADPPGAVDRGLFRSGSNKAKMVFTGSSGGVGTTSIPTDGTTKFSMAANWQNDVNVENFYGLESGSLTSDSTATNPGNWGSTNYVVQSIGGFPGQNTQPFKPFIVAVFGRQLTLSEYQTLHDDWFGELIDAGAPPAAELAGSATASATATGDLTTSAATKGVRVQLHDGATEQASVTGIKVAWWDDPDPSTQGAPVYQSGSVSLDASGWLEIDIDAVTALALGAEGWLTATKPGATREDDITFSGRLPVVSI